MSARKVPKNYRNITGQISSYKSEKAIAFESKLERDFYFIFDFDKNVTSIQDQPFKIEYIEEKEGSVKIKSYTPDVYLERKDGYPNIIGEVKYYENLKTEWGVLKPKFQAARKYARQQKDETIFVIFTERCPKIANKDFIRNIHFLDDYNTYSIEAYQTIKELYEENITIKELLEEYSMDEMEQMRLIPSLWALVREEVVEVDLFQWLTLNTKILGVKDIDGFIS